jgi:hypothetical protein
MPDPLDTVLRIRRMALDDAVRCMAACLRAEDSAGQAAKAADAAIEAECESAADLAGEDAAVAAFAAWLPVGRACAAACYAALETAVAETGRARAAMTITRAAAEAASSLADRRAAERKMAVERRAQAVLDEIGGQNTGGLR